MGRRVCLGEKLALAHLFSIVVNLLQQTSGYEFALSDGPGTNNLGPDPNNPTRFYSSKYKVLLIPV